MLDEVIALGGFLAELLFSDDYEERKRRKERKPMPLASIQDLPDSSRTWVFGSDHTLDSAKSEQLLKEVDRFLTQWKRMAPHSRAAGTGNTEGF